MEYSLNLNRRDLMTLIDALSFYYNNADDNCNEEELSYEKSLLDYIEAKAGIIH